MHVDSAYAWNKGCVDGSHVDGVMWPSSLPVDVTSVPGRPWWALGLLREGLTAERGRLRPQSESDPAAASKQLGCLFTFCSRDVGQQVCKPQLG